MMLMTLEEPPPSPRERCGRPGLREEGGPAGVEVEDGGPALGRQVPQLGVVALPGVVDEDVDTPKLFHRRRDEHRGPIHGRHVGLDRDGLGGQGVAHSLCVCQLGWARIIQDKDGTA